LVRFVDVGEQQSRFGMSRQAELAFEIAGQKTADGQPMLCFKRIFNLSPRSKNFRDVVRALTGLHDIAQVNTRDLVGKVCTVEIAHNTNDDGQTFANVECSALRGKAPPPPVSDIVFLSLHPEDFHVSDLKEVSDRQREKIVASRTYKELINPPKVTRAADIIDDDFPENLGGEKKKDAA
jgi:hypothetical protein